MSAIIYRPGTACRGWMTWLTAVLLAAGYVTLALGSGLKSDESAILLPSYAVQAESGTWTADIHAWVFELEQDSALRKVLKDSIARYVNLPKEGAERRRFDERMTRFLVDNEGDKVLHIGLDDRIFHLNPTKANGHSHSRLQLSRCPGSEAGQDVCSGWMHYALQAQDGRPGTGRLHLIPAQGLSVISDIDDTIKISHVMDSDKMLRTAFLEEYRPVPGMSCLYRRWAQDGAAFHYVSASPWHLYPWLSRFTERHEFPPGVFRLFAYRLKDKSALDLFSSPMEKKYPVLERVVTDFPQRHFILVGDSGEADPEVYGALARNYAHQIKKIYIRVIPGSDLSEQRWKQAFTRVDKNTWQLFQHPAEIERTCSG